MIRLRALADLEMGGRRIEKGCYFLAPPAWAAHLLDEKLAYEAPTDAQKLAKESRR